MWGHDLHHTTMDEISKTSTPEYPALVPGRWVGLLVAAVVLAEAIWELLVSLTNNLFLPLMAKVIGAEFRGPFEPREGLPIEQQISAAGIRDQPSSVELGFYIDDYPLVTKNHAETL